VHIDLYIALAGLIVGFAVGLTGMGGGALMTPILVLLFHVQPVAAVASDLVASLVMKPVGAAVHAGRGTVRWGLVAWLAIASVPSAFLGVAFLKWVGDGTRIQTIVSVTLGAVNAEVSLALDDATTVTAIITNESVGTLGLAEGQTAIAAFKASSVILGVTD